MTYEEKLATLGDKFRGLWRYQRFDENSREAVVKWSCTIQVGLNIYDSSLKDTIHEALDESILTAERIRY